LYKSVTKGKEIMADKNYSWKGSPNAGKVLMIVAAVGAVAVFLAGFLG